MPANRRPRVMEPSFVERRGERQLLVYGDVARWLIVDAELAGFLDLLDGRRKLPAVVREHAQRWGRPPEAVAADAAAILADLDARGLLGAATAVEPESVRVVNVTVNITNRCNLTCPWCYNADRASRELPVDQLMDAVEAARPLYAPNASFIILGGEPFLVPDRTLRAIERAERIFRPPVLVSTNGTTLSAGLARRLAARDVEVQVSLDASTAAVHDAARGAGVFARATEGVRLLRAAGVPTVVSMVYTADTFTDFEAYLDMALELGVDEARFIPMRQLGRGQPMGEVRPDQAAAFESLLEVLTRRPDLRPLLRRDWFSILATTCQLSLPRTGCGVARKVLFLDADGAVFPCPNHVGSAHHCGNVAETPVVDMVAESPVLREMRHRYVVDAYSACRGCAFRYWCAGDCRGEALAVTGDPTAPSPHCESLRALIPRLFWLLGTEPLAGWPAGLDGVDVRDVFRT